MTAALWELIIGGLWPYLLAASGAVFLFLLGVLKGGAKANARRDAKDAKGFKKTTERMQDADAAMGDDPAGLRDWLRHRNSDQR
jgi:hypothetical protein